MNGDVMVDTVRHGRSASYGVTFAHNCGSSVSELCLPQSVTYCPVCYS